MDLESNCHQFFVINLYPPCPQPELAMGLPPHSDHGLLIILMQNDLQGLQVHHNGRWVSINPLPDSFIVNIGDHMEYKSVLHRAVVNRKATRLSILTSHGPPPDKVVAPAPELLHRENRPPAYRGITYKEYIELQQTNSLDGKSCLTRVLI
ncbi:hypothetical protein EZV62_021896 [Acer yangbiense]|uniref:Fe2OG dioxygenase domain-containing protein n=1 Tax=Acer yangbiense TaxID=1000413 RepID=A0A5C7H705_9ROSI|nr:hypothetical protein EZV62_021896 [Acer yangbiense]